MTEQQPYVLPEPESCLTQAMLAQLMTDLHPGRVATRSQGGKNLSYVEAHDIKAMLIRIFGFGGFAVNVIDSEVVQIRESQTTPGHVDTNGRAKTPMVVASATVMLTIYGLGPNGQDVSYTESAASGMSANDIGDATDNALKAAASDALKRCATYLGTQFGLSLYKNGSREEIVKVIFQERQAEMLGQIHEDWNRMAAEQQAIVQQQLDRATGKDSQE